VLVERRLAISGPGTCKQQSRRVLRKVVGRLKDAHTFYQRWKHSPYRLMAVTAARLSQSAPSWYFSAADPVAGISCAPVHFCRSSRHEQHHQHRIRSFRRLLSSSNLLYHSVKAQKAPATHFSSTQHTFLPQHQQQRLRSIARNFTRCVHARCCTAAAAAAPCSGTAAVQGPA
jgi:hypothetical protein